MLSMNPVPFREYHLFTLLEAYEKQTLPLDLFISHYFKAHKALGSKDRGFIAETAYALIRWLSLLNYLSDKPLSWERRYYTYHNLNWEEAIQREDIPLTIRVSFPSHLFNLIVDSYGR